MSILVNNLTKKYGRQTAVNGISFSAKSGEITGFLGPNGAGKSTTMKMITGYLHKDSGEIKVCGELVSPEGISTKKNIGYLPESNPLYYDMYVKEYLHFVAGLHNIKDTNAAVNKVIEQVGLTPEAGKKTGQLSKGYKQRVGLAAAIIHEPQVLILDEPTNGLDPNQIIEIRNVIKSLAKDKTILLSSHIMQEVEALCDRIVIINKGNIVADDSLQHLKETGSGKEYILVVFDKNVETSELEKLPGAGTISKAGIEIKIITENKETFRRALMQYSVDKDINILSMQQGSSSIEDVFRNLTENSTNE